MSSALQLIVEWAENELVAWKSDAVRRMLTQDELDESDKKRLAGDVERSTRSI